MTDAEKQYRWPAKLAGDRFLLLPDEFLPLCENGLATKFGDRALLFSEGQIPALFASLHGKRTAQRYFVGNSMPVEAPDDLARALARYFGPADPEVLPFWRAKVRFETHERFTEIFLCETQRLEEI